MSVNLFKNNLPWLDPGDIDRSGVSSVLQLRCTRRGMSSADRATLTAGIFLGILLGDGLSRDPFGAGGCAGVPLDFLIVALIFIYFLSRC